MEKFSIKNGYVDSGFDAFVVLVYPLIGPLYNGYPMQLI